MKNLKRLKGNLLNSLSTFQDALRGSIYEMKRFCGKSSCHCMKTNTPHKSLCLSLRYNGRTHIVHIQNEQVSKIKKMFKRYEQLKEAIDKLSWINAMEIRENRKGKSK